MRVAARGRQRYLKKACFSTRHNAKTVRDMQKIWISFVVPCVVMILSKQQLIWMQNQGGVRANAQWAKSSFEFQSNMADFLCVIGWGYNDIFGLSQDALSRLLDNFVLFQKKCAHFYIGVNFQVALWSRCFWDMSSSFTNMQFHPIAFI